MPVTQAKPGPYAPTSTVLDVVSRYRSGLPKPITTEVLARAGIAESLIPRTLQALQTLDLIDKDGAPTQTLEGLRLAAEADYRAKLAAWVRSAYADIIVFADPAKADSTRIRDAFRGYEPRGQQARMVSLFQGLSAAAGLVADKPARAVKAAPNFTPRERTVAKRIVAERFKDAPRHPSSLPAPLAGLLQSLPAEGDTWTKAEREKFLATFTPVLDFCFPVVEKSDTAESEALDAIKTALRRA
ncbi:MAG TPA: DUF5343 domain-containing protein [Pseudolabrys sp.]